MNSYNEFNLPLLEAHIQQWFANTAPSVSGIKITRLDSLNLQPIAGVLGLQENELRQFALAQGSLSADSLFNLIAVLDCLGYTPPSQ